MSNLIGNLILALIAGELFLVAGMFWLCCGHLVRIRVFLESRKYRQDEIAESLETLTTMVKGVVEAQRGKGP